MVGHGQKLRSPAQTVGNLSYAGMGPALNPSKKSSFYSLLGLQLQLIKARFYVFLKILNKGKTMNRCIKSLSLGALLALVMASASAQSPAPATGASAPSTVGVTPQEATRANQQAVPRSDTATVVRTAPSPADRASAALGGATTDTTTRATTAGSAAPAGTRGARADRN